MNTGICAARGRNEANGLISFSLWNFMISCCWRYLSSSFLYFAWIAFICGVTC